MKVFFIRRNGNDSVEALISPDFATPQEMRITHEGVEILGDPLRLDSRQTEMADAFLGVPFGPNYDLRLEKLCRVIKIGIRYGITGKLSRHQFLRIATQRIVKHPVGNRALTTQFLSIGFMTGRKLRRHAMAISR